MEDREILILRHQLTVLPRLQPRRPNLNWADRALIATLLSLIPKARRHGLRLLVTPDTVLRRHRDIVRRRWTARSRRGKSGRPATRRNIRALVLRLARENPEWGYRRIHGEMGGLGVKVAASTVWEILKNAGIDPAPRRTGPAWSQFLRSQAEAILACDFFTADLLDCTQAYVLAVVEHATRRDVDEVFGTHRCGKGPGPAPGIADTTRYHIAMAMTLRLSDEQTEALRRKAEAEHRSMQQVALAAIDAYVHQATPARRQSVPVTELMTVFQDLPPMSAEAFRADQDRYADAEAYFDAYERIHGPEDGE